MKEKVLDVILLLATSIQYVAAQQPPPVEIKPEAPPGIGE